ncbi:MAG TPA: sugar ABC transporter permease [Actinomycetota bacterium]|nr:sugar ABC transporter permease [Actinomycetota bacterium]
MRGTRGLMARREERAAYLFLSPWLLGLLAFWLIPIVGSLLLSFSEWNIISPPEWVGLENYRDMIDDRTFWVSIRVTLKYLILSVPLYIVCGLLLSLILNLKIRGINVFRTILFLPSVLSGVAVAVLWVALLNPDVGAVNEILRAIGIDDPPRWLDSPTWAVPSVVLVGLWGIGGGAIIYLAGLQNIPAQLYEASLLDGAGPWQRFRYVTLPMITPTLLFVLLTSLIEAFQVFDIAYVLSRGGQGGLGDSLQFYLINLWNEAFVNGHYGYASALAWVLVLAAAAVILVIFRTSGRWVYYEYDPERER